MNYKLIASDLDGTLFGSNGRISEENLAAIAELHRRGVHFVPASGRSFDEMPGILKEHPLIRYYITSDGGTVYDKETQKSYLLTLPPEVSERVLDKLYQYPVNMMLHADSKSYVDAALHNDADYKRCNYSQTWRTFVYAKDVPVTDFKSFAYACKAVEMFCVFFENMEDLIECKAYFDKMPEVLCAQTDPYNLEVFSVAGGKGNALRMLSQKLGIDIRDTIAMGDTTNDMTMVQAAGLGLAMGNAVPALQAAADKVIVDHDNHALQYVLENFIK